MPLSICESQSPPGMVGQTQQHYSRSDWC